MGDYRNDGGALREKVGELEGDLEAARDEIARLRGQGPTPPAAIEVPHSRVLGTASMYWRNETLPFLVSEAGYVAIARVLRERLGLAPTQVGGDLNAAGFSMTRDGDRTHVRFVSDFSARAWGVVSASLLSGIFPGLGIVGVLMDVATHTGAEMLPLHAIWAIPSVMVATGVGMRALARRGVRRETERFDGTLAAVLDLAREHAIGGAPVRARVETPDAPEALADAEAPEAARAHPGAAQAR